MDYYSVAITYRPQYKPLHRLLQESFVVYHGRIFVDVQVLEAYSYPTKLDDRTNAYLIYVIVS